MANRAALSWRFTIGQGDNRLDVRSVREHVDGLHGVDPGREGRGDLEIVPDRLGFARDVNSPVRPKPAENVFHHAGRASLPRRIEYHYVGMTDRGQRRFDGTRDELTLIVRNPIEAGARFAIGNGGTIGLDRDDAVAAARQG